MFAVCFLLQHTANAKVCCVLDICRVFFGLTHGKEKVCCVLFLLAHGKGQVCRVPEFAHMAEPWAHGNPAVSVSVTSSAEQIGRLMMLCP